MSDDEAYARKPAEIIDAWSTTLKTVKNHDARLLVGMAGQKYCNAAELLKHTWDGWPEENQQQFRSMARDVWYPVIKDFHPSANGNWDASMLQTMIAMGVFLDAREMFDRAVNYYLEGEGNGAVRNYFGILFAISSWLVSPGSIGRFSLRSTVDPDTIITSLNIARTPNDQCTRPHAGSNLDPDHRL